MTEREGLLVIGLVAGLALCSLADAVMIMRLRADVDFLTAVSEKNLIGDTRG